MMIKWPGVMGQKKTVELFQKEQSGGPPETQRLQSAVVFRPYELFATTLSPPALTSPFFLYSDFALQQVFKTSANALP